MSKVEAVRRALLEIGNVSAEELAAFASRHYGVNLDPLIVPVIKATLKDRVALAGGSRSAIAPPPRAA